MAIWFDAKFLSDNPYSEEDVIAFVTAFDSPFEVMVFMLCYKALHKWPNTKVLSFNVHFVNGAPELVLVLFDMFLEAQRKVVGQQDVYHTCAMIWREYAKGVFVAAKSRSLEDLDSWDVLIRAPRKLLLDSNELACDDLGVPSQALAPCELRQSLLRKLRRIEVHRAALEWVALHANPTTQKRKNTRLGC